MSLVPVDKQTGKKRPLNEHDKGRVRQQKEKAEWHKRNRKNWKH